MTNIDEATRYGLNPKDFFLLGEVNNGAIEHFNGDSELCAGGLYVIIFPDGQKYIGQTTNYRRRFTQHCSTVLGNRKGNPKIKKAYLDNNSLQFFAYQSADEPTMTERKLANLLSPNLNDYECTIDRTISTDSFFQNVVAPRIRAVLKEKGIKIIDLAEALGVTQPAISGTLSEGSPSLDKLNDIAGVIGVSPSELIANCIPWQGWRPALLRHLPPGVESDCSKARIGTDRQPVIRPNYGQH